MNFIRWFNWFNREKITLLIASLALVLGAIFPWYRLPPQALETFGTNLSLATAGRVLAALFALLNFAFVFCFSLSRAPRLFFWTGLISVLLFPYFISTWSPTVNFLATAYYDQATRVSEHVDTNFSQVQSQWKQNISLARSIPVTSIFDFSIKDSRFFQMSSWDEIIIEGLGYTNHFFAYIGGRGWGMTVLGLVLSLMAFYLGVSADNLNFFIRDMGTFLPWIGLVIVILFFSMILPNIINHQLDAKFTKGEYHQVVVNSHILASLYPPLSGDEAFLKRLAEAGYYGNEPDPGLIYFAQGLARYYLEDFVKAEDYFQRALNIQPRNFLVRGYLVAAILNQGVIYFNTPDTPNVANDHKPAAAADRFEEALRIFPGQIEALYDLMLARIVNGEFEKSALAAQQLIETQQYSQQRSLGLLGQAYLHTDWASFHNGDLTQAWKQYRQSFDSSTWEKSSKVSK